MASSLYEMAKGDPFDPIGALEHGLNFSYRQKINQNKLAELARADQARPLIGNALMGDQNAYKSLAGIDPGAYMDVGKFQSDQNKAKREVKDADMEMIAGAVYNADTPEKYARTMDYLAQQGFDIDDDDRNFANRDTFINMMRGVKGATQADQFDRGYGLDQMNAETSRINAMKKPEGGAGFALAPGQTRYDANGAIIATAPSKPVQPRALTSVDKNAILEADDQVQAGKNVIDMLNQALALNDKAGSGMMAGAQAFAARNDPTGFFDDEKGAATTDFNNIVLGQALTSMKSIFGGNPTEGERAVLMELQGAADKTPTERASIIKRGIALAQKRVAFNAERAKEIRSGGYFGGASTVETQGQPDPGADGITQQDQGGTFEQGANPFASDPSFGQESNGYSIGQSISNPNTGEVLFWDGNDWRAQ